MLQRGQVWLEHSIEADDAFHLANLLKELSEPFLVLSRQSPPRMENHLKSGLEHYRWLSETEHECTLEPSLESIRTTVDTFFEQHKKCALIMEGIEYLSGIHGEQRVIEMIRSIVDQTRLNGNVFILTSNLEAFSTEQRARLERECSRLSKEQLQSWVLDVEILADHPYFQTIDEEEEAALGKHLEENTHDPVIASEPTVLQPASTLPVEHQSMKVDEELQSKMMEWAEESDEEQEVFTEEPETMDEQVERLLERKPRTPQRLVRRRKHTPQLSKGNTLDAAARHERTLPNLRAVDSNKAKQFVPLASSREHAFPPSKPSLPSKGIDQAVASTAGKILAQFPPIKSTGHIPVAVSTPKRQRSNTKTSPHAREHASAKQRFSDEHEPEGDA